MKVGTDGVLIGAWANIENAERILDIGTGTGLITLMLAQRSNAKITGIEIDPEAALQAQENAKQSPWPQQIEIIEGKFQDWALEINQKWDHIVTNPPFFNNSLKAPDLQRNIARHSDMLSQEDLIQGVSIILSDKGKFSLILPYTEAQLFIVEAALKHLYCTSKVLVKPSPNKKANRVLMTFSKERCVNSEKEMVIRDSLNNYTPEFIELTKEFYLKF